MVSEILEEAGIDRDRLQQIRRQVLEGVILMCQWQLERMEEPRPKERSSAQAAQGRRRVSRPPGG